MVHVLRGTEAFEVTIVGGGHAGCEAALASARLGCTTALVTFDRLRIAHMSCNPAIGGLGKSQIVREIDALGGEMGRVADASAIQCRRLNESRGPAVRARRMQCDLEEYSRIMRETVESSKRITVIEESAEALMRGPDGVITGIQLRTSNLCTKAVVIATGTFLKGLMHQGLESNPGGRIGDPAAENLSLSLRGLGLRMARLKTGTPPRLRADSISFEGMEKQVSDPVFRPFSHEGGPRETKDDAICYLTRTNERTHAIIRNNLERSPLYSGRIVGRGPRYCPSIEDKVVRFRERQGHQVVLEPTNWSGKVMYPNGISTSLPADVQLEFVRTIRGLEEAVILEAGYAVEYDAVDPRELRRDLGCRNIPGLFLAGQINGTSGYEEAAGQGLIAGINAARWVKGFKPIVLGRHEAYIGVMIDDLTSRGTEEPYRMFSSRAEHRLHLREDNALERLAAFAEEIGLVEEERLEQRRKRISERKKLFERARTERVLSPEGERITIEQLIRRPGQKLAKLANGWTDQQDLIEQVEVDIKYAGYIERERREVDRLRAQENRKIPKDFPYRELQGLSRELVEKLERQRPPNIGSARQVDGMTPAALMVLSLALDRQAGRVPRGT